MTDFHIHDFRIHVGILVFGGERLAWVDQRFVDRVGGGPFMWRCSECGEQGYAIPDSLEVGSE